MQNKTVFDNGILYQGDALAVLRELPTASVDAILTDPPYSSGGLHAGARRVDPAKKYQLSETRRNYPPMLGDLKDQRSFTTWATLWLSECWRLARPGSPCLVFTDWRQLPAMTDAVQGAGFEWRGIVIWHKPNSRPRLGDFRHEAEFVIHAAKAPAKKFTRRCFPGVYRYAVNAATKVHLTSKPVPLIVDLLGVVAEGGTVLDPFTGGGATGVACVETNRQFVGVELSSEYAKLAGDRIAAVELARLQK